MRLIKYFVILGLFGFYNPVVAEPPIPIKIVAAESARSFIKGIPDAGMRGKTIEEELNKIKIPTEQTDELLAYKLNEEKLNPPGKKNKVTINQFVSWIQKMSNPSARGANTTVTVKNNSSLAVQCVLTALHTTSAQTPFFSKKYNKYIAQTPISSPEIIKPYDTQTISLDVAGVDIAQNETVIAMNISAGQVTSKKHIKASYDEKTLVTDITTNTWILNTQKKLQFNSKNNPVEFPQDFVQGPTRTDSKEGPNYFVTIAYMRACEKIFNRSLFPAQLFDHTYISRLSKEEFDHLNEFIMKKFHEKPKLATLGSLLDSGKYNFVAAALAQIFFSIVMLLIPGGQASIASNIASTVETIVDQSIAIGKGVKALKGK